MISRAITIAVAQKVDNLISTLRRSERQPLFDLAV
jgi:hypothetical protein